MKRWRTFEFFVALAVMLFIVAGCGSSTPGANGTEIGPTQSGAEIPSTRDSSEIPPVLGNTEFLAAAGALPKGFVYLSDVIPDAILEIRYYGTYNFVGTRVDDYLSPVAIISEEAARALKQASDDLKARGYALKVFDAYRPQGAVDHFVRWVHDKSDIAVKKYFYPDIEKNRLLSEGYIARRSGHSRGSTVDLTILDMKTGKEADMGSPFDFLGPISNHGSNLINSTQTNNRLILRRTMEKAGFRAYGKEWWHYTLINEPYPNTYFSFPVK